MSRRSEPTWRRGIDKLHDVEPWDCEDATEVSVLASQGVAAAWWLSGMADKEGLVVVHPEQGDTAGTTGQRVLAGWIPGRPAGKPAGRGGHRGRHANVWAMASRPVKLWKAAVERQAREAITAAGGLEAIGDLLGSAAIGIEIKFVFPSKVAERWGEDHTGKPDVDNLQKLLFDVWTKAGLTGGLDDAHISLVEARKVWGAVAGAGWVITRLEPQEIGQAVGVAGRGAGAPPWWALDEGEEAGG